jgi:hypothetical protein
VERNDESPQVPGVRRAPGPGDVAWSALAATSALLFLLNIAGVVVALVRVDGQRLLLAPVGLLCTYWITMGAWRRTAWGGPDADRPIPGPPSLSARSAKRYIAVAFGCGAALVIAVSAQALLA